MPNLGQGGGPDLGGLGFNRRHSHLLACSSYKSLEYFPYSIIPPNTNILVPSHTNPYAAHPGGMSPLTAGTNHWFVARRKNCTHFKYSDNLSSMTSAFMQNVQCINKILLDAKNKTYSLQLNTLKLKTEKAIKASKYLNVFYWDAKYMPTAYTWKRVHSSVT